MISNGKFYRLDKHRERSLSNEISELHPEAILRKVLGGGRIEMLQYVERETGICLNHMFLKFN